VPRVCHYHQTPTAVPPDRHHRGVAPVPKFFSNRLIEFPHQCDLFQRAKVPVHELSELLAEHCHCLSVAAHIGKRDPRDAATRAH
jgi:hypothetical protein